MALVWKDPPVNRIHRNSFDWNAIIAELKMHPGQWALVVENVAPSTANPLKLRQCVVRTSQVSARPQRVDVYAMWSDNPPAAA